MPWPVLAITWELWTRNRAGILAAHCAVVALALIGVLLPAPNATENLIPLSAAVLFIQFLYVLAISVNPDFRFHRAEIGFPSWKFTLPVKTSTLVFVHVSFGLALLTSLWLSTFLLVWRPRGIELIWELVGGLPVALVWAQAICWCLPGRPWTQLIAGCFLIPCLYFSAAISLMIVYFCLSFASIPITYPVYAVGSFLAALMVAGLGWIVAYEGVARDRCGKSRFLRGTFSIPAVASGTFARIKPFSSKAAAQLWYESHRSVAMFLPFFGLASFAFLGLIDTPVRGSMALVFQVFLFEIVLLMAALCVGYGIGKSSFWGSLELPAWYAVRPVTSGSIAIAKLRIAGLAALATWLILLPATPYWIFFVGATELVSAHTKFLISQVGTTGAIVEFAAIFLSLLALTWGQIVGGLCLALTSRHWVVNGVAGLGFVLLSAFVACWRSVTLYPEAASFTWGVWTGVTSALVFAKIAGAVACLYLGHQQGLVDWKQLIPSICLWGAGIASILAVVLIYIPTAIRQIPFVDSPLAPLPPLLASLVCILSLPLVRLTALPLAVATGRHR